MQNGQNGQNGLQFCVYLIHYFLYWFVYFKKYSQMKYYFCSIDWNGSELCLRKIINRNMGLFNDKYFDFNMHRSGRFLFWFNLISMFLHHHHQIQFFFCLTLSLTPLAWNNKYKSMSKLTFDTLLIKYIWLCA